LEHWTEYNRSDKWEEGVFRKTGKNDGPLYKAMDSYALPTADDLDRLEAGVMKLEEELAAFEARRLVRRLAIELGCGNRELLLEAVQGEISKLLLLRGQAL
jgi:hypothetical protein